MKLKQICTLAAAAALTIASAGDVLAAATIQNVDHPAGTPWTGFDWDPSGSVLIQGFQAVQDDVFTLQFWSNAKGLNNGVTSIATPGLDVNANGALDSGKTYEYTVYASLTEKVSAVNSDGSVSFTVTGGTFEIWYDTAGDADRDLITGFQNGDKIISGSFGLQPGGTFTDIGFGSGFGVSVLRGDVLYTNNAYINPDLLATTAVTTLQIGDYLTNGWTVPSALAGQGIVLQADANQSFSVVPEPGSLALFGVALSAMGLVRRRKV